MDLKKWKINAQSLRYLNIKKGTVMGKIFVFPEKKFPLSAIQLFLLRWLALMTFACLVNSLCVIVFRLYSQPFGFDFILPFISCGVAWAIIFFAIYKDREHTVYNDYIRDNYPDAWKAMHPFGDFSIDTFAVGRFLAGKFDDGNDEKINEIKFHAAVYQYLQVWAFFLIFIVWGFNFFLIVMA